MKQKIILAYSGGLDTSVILKWFINQGHEVVCFIADIGQNEDFAQAQAKALKLGASKVYIEDLKQEFVEQYIFQALKANALYEGNYLLGTALARPLIAKKQIEIAHKEGTTCVAHGATGKGNDQVRFELTYLQLMPNATIISPWKDPVFLAQFSGREDMIQYAYEQHIPITSTLKKPYSIDENIMHISYEAGILEDPAAEATEDMYTKIVDPQHAPDSKTKIAITFKEGVPVAVTNLTEQHTVTGSLELFTYLNTLGGANGIGRIDIVENRFVGMKSRGVYETPAGTILYKAHRDLENLVLDREVSHLKDMLMPKIAELIYNGFWFSPEMAFLIAAINHSQENLNGTVHLALYKGNAYVTARTSPNSLYNETLASMNSNYQYNQTDASGFIKLQGLRLTLSNKQHTKETIK